MPAPTPRVDTKPLTAVAARKQATARAARAAITARLAPVLTPDEQHLAEALELHLQGRFTPRDVLHIAQRRRPPHTAPLYPETLLATLVQLRRRAPIKDALDGNCPPGTRCAAELCPWHRRALKRWWDARDPLVRALLAPDPATALAKEAQR